jgi:hypothetical protein
VVNINNKSFRGAIQMLCPELRNDEYSAEKVYFKYYDFLQESGQNLIRSWFGRAWENRNCSNENSFEPFIFTWFAFNSWAACVTDVDKDAIWKLSLMENTRLCSIFNKLVSDKSSSFYAYANDFYNMWPIFRAQTIRHKGALLPYCKNRSELINFYFRKRIRYFEPQCWCRHEKEGGKTPLDWPHTLSALYNVRCNLFHGEKAIESEMDQQIVSAAFKVLVHFIKEAKLIT